VSTTQYPLAYDADGNPLAVPEGATSWRVRRGGRRGRPKLVFDAETGRQLEFPITATFEDLLEAGLPGDRYRLEAVDASGRNLPNVIAIIEVPESEEEAAEKQRELAAEVQPDPLLARLVDSNVRAIEAMASAFGPLGPARTLPPPPVVMAPEQPRREEPAIQPEKIMEMLITVGKMLADTFKPSAPSAPPPPPAGGAS
jgi:hypothetical protein